jgi:hypothetical protein
MNEALYACVVNSAVCMQAKYCPPRSLIRLARLKNRYNPISAKVLVMTKSLSRTWQDRPRKRLPQQRQPVFALDTNKPMMQLRM